MNDLRINDFFNRKTSSVETMLGYGDPITARYVGKSPSISMPKTPDISQQMALMQQMMADQRADAQAQWQMRQDEVREQEALRLEMEADERTRLQRVEEERQAAVLASEQMAIDEAEGVVVEEEEEDPMVYGFYGLYDDLDEEEFDDNPVPE